MIFLLYNGTYYNARVSSEYFSISNEKQCAAIALYVRSILVLE
jgi:hypothetical protein